MLWVACGKKTIFVSGLEILLETKSQASTQAADKSGYKRNFEWLFLETTFSDYNARIIWTFGRFGEEKMIVGW